MSYAPAALFLTLAVLAGCGTNLRSKEKVQAAILERLQTKTGLSMKDLDVTTTDVRFDKNLAYATVSIHPKGDAALSHGMAMQYTLEDRDGKWVVVKLNGAGASGGSGLPTAHSGAGSDLPPGHPSVAPGSSGDADPIPNPHSSLPDQAPQAQGGPNR